jgi:hypothetical protein
MKFRY